MSIHKEGGICVYTAFLKLPLRKIFKLETAIYSQNLETAIYSQGERSEMDRCFPRAAGLWFCKEFDKKCDVFFDGRI